ncbi:MAG: rod shape-determining protein RodA [Planctomycetota bacterium]
MLRPFTRDEWKRFPVGLVLTLAAIVAISLICIASASWRPVAEGEWVNDGYHLKQLQWIGISLVLGGIAAALPYVKLLKYSWFVYLFGLSLLLAVAVMGKTVNGSKRWIDLKFMMLQPSEIVKLTVIVALAFYLRCCKTHRTLRGLVGPGLIVAAPMLLILKQPDLGTSLCFVPVFFAMLYIAGAKKRHLGLMIGLGGGAAAIYGMFFMKAYQLGRLTAFLDPETVARAEGYHLIQSRTAIGAGGLLGNGFAHGAQNALGYLPENHTDFVFAVMGEEWGLIGCALVLLLYGLLITRILMIGMEVREPFGRLFCVGLATLIGFQVFVNVGMTVGMMPITGLTLPFFSYGGSSLFAMAIGIGLVINIRMRQVAFY